LVDEASQVREAGDVTVRHDGPGSGRAYFYKERRQLSHSHNHVGKVTNGRELLRIAPQGSRLTCVTDPARVMVVGMTQAQAGRALEERGLKQKRSGLRDDDAVVAEQEPELTMEIAQGSEVETMGVAASKVAVVSLVGNSPKTVRYFKRMTGLDHKPVGSLKIFFTYPDMPMITFEGNASQASSLLPEEPFGPSSPRGQLGVTNMSRPSRGTIGLRLSGIEEFGPTGEERYGTNVVGSLVSPVDDLMDGAADGGIVYFRLAKEGEDAPVEEVDPMLKIPDELAEIAAGEFRTYESPATPFGAAPERDVQRDDPDEEPPARKAAPKKTAKTRAKKPSARKPSDKAAKQGSGKKPPAKAKSAGAAKSKEVSPRQKRPKQG